MQLNPAEISELIKSRIEGLAVSADIRNEGTVVSVTDGICRVHGLSEAMQGEMLEFPAAPDGSPKEPAHLLSATPRDYRRSVAAKTQRDLQATIGFLAPTQVEREK